MGTLWQDIKYGSRMLARNPDFTALVVVILAIGIAATTAMLSVVDTVMFQSCPCKDPETLVYIHENSRRDRKTGAIARNIDNRTSLPTLRDWRARNHVFESLGGVVQWLDSTAQSAGKKEKTGPQYVSPGFFSALGVRPILGRTFAPEEEKPGGERVAILSCTHWQHWFAGDPNVIGKTLLVDRQACTVVGVLPADFRWLFYPHPIAPGLWMPAALLPEQMNRRDTGGVIAVGRLRAGVDLSQARAEMNLIATQLAQECPETMGAVGVSVVPLSEKAGSYVLRAGKPRVLLMMLGVAASVLLIACLHVASLLIARSAEREMWMVRMLAKLSIACGIAALFLADLGIYGIKSHLVASRTPEIGIRMAFGAEGTDILKLVIKRGTVLAFLGLALGVAGTFVLTRCMRGLLFEISPRDPATFVCVSLLLAAVALLASYLPARRAAKVDPMITLRYE